MTTNRRPAGGPTSSPSRSPRSGAAGRSSSAAGGAARKRQFLVIGAATAAAIVGLIVLVGRNRGEIANLRSAPPEGGIVIVGDSLAAGVGARPEESFPSLLSASLGCRITNAGVSGNTTADGLARIDRILAGRPWIVVVELGGNDFLGKIDKGETRRNLDEILRRIAASGSIPAVAAIELGLFTDEYGDIFEEAARRNRAFLIPDILGGVLGKPSLMADGIHPNAAGYRIVADRLDDHLRTLIARTGATCR